MKPKAVLLLILISVGLLGSGAARKPAMIPVPTKVIVPTPAAEHSVKPETSVKLSAAARELSEAQEAIGDLTADFTLIIAGAAKDGGDFTAQGKMWLTTGRRYAVQYEEPERQRLISNGKKRWLCLEKINQVQIQSLPPAGNPTDFFLELGGGLPALIKQCQVKRFKVNNGRSDTFGFELVPLAGTNPGFQKVQLWLQGKQLLPLRVVVAAARQVRVEFRKVSIHTVQELLRDPEKGVPASRFTFEPPADAEVIQMF